RSTWSSSTRWTVSTSCRTSLTACRSLALARPTPSKPSATLSSNIANTSTNVAKTTLSSSVGNGAKKNGPLGEAPPKAITFDPRMITTAVFDTKAYDRDTLQRAAANLPIEWRFQEFRLGSETAVLAKGADAVCVFVNDQLDRPCLETLAAQGVKLAALRCTGFNNVD